MDNSKVLEKRLIGTSNLGTRSYGSTDWEISWVPHLDVETSLRPETVTAA